MFEHDSCKMLVQLLEDILQLKSWFGMSSPMSGRVQSVVAELKGGDSVTEEMVRNGLKIAELALALVCWNLKLSEDVVNKIFDEFMSESHRPAAQLDYQLEHILHVIDNELCHRRGIHDFMVDDYLWKVYCDHAEEISDAILREIKVIYNADTSLHQVIWNLFNGQLWFMHFLHGNAVPLNQHQGMSNAISVAVNNAICVTVKPLSENWIENIVKPSSPIGSEVVAVENMVRERWMLNSDEGRVLLDSFIDYFHVQMLPIQRRVMSNSCQDSAIKIGHDVVGAVADVLIADIYNCVGAGGIPQFVLAHGPNSGMFRQYVEQHIVDELERRVRHRLSSAIRNRLMEGRIRIKELLHPVVEEGMGQLQGEIREILIELRKQFDCSISYAQELMCKCMAEKKRVADEARSLRDNRIKRLRLEIERLSVG